MININFSKELFEDKRLSKLNHKLARRLNDPAEDGLALATGYLLIAFAMAQAEASADNPRALISLQKWTSRDMPQEIIDSGFAVIENDCVYVRGAEEFCKFKVEKSLAGRKGGLNSGVTRAEAKRSKTKQTEANGSETNPISLSLALIKNTEEEAPTSFDQAKDEIPEAVLAGFRATYTEASIQNSMRRCFDRHLVDRDKRSFAQHVVTWLHAEKCLEKLPGHKAPPLDLSIYVDSSPPVPDEINRSAERMGLNYRMKT